VNIFVSKYGQQYGPYTIEQLREYVQQGYFTTSDLALYEGGIVNRFVRIPIRIWIRLWIWMSHNIFGHSERDIHIVYKLKYYWEPKWVSIENIPKFDNASLSVKFARGYNFFKLAIQSLPAEMKEMKDEFRNIVKFLILFVAGISVVVTLVFGLLTWDVGSGEDIKIPDLVMCGVCSTPVSSAGDACPRCDHPVDKSIDAYVAGEKS
jgi:hypothetical protein